MATLILVSDKCQHYLENLLVSALQINLMGRTSVQFSQSIYNQDITPHLDKRKARGSLVHIQQ